MRKKKAKKDETKKKVVGQSTERQASSSSETRKKWRQEKHQPKRFGQLVERVVRTNGGGSFGEVQCRGEQEGRMQGSR